MAKDKTAKKEKKKSGKKATGKSTISRAKATTVKLANNPIVADIVAATLVAAAAALKDSKKARALAEAGADGIGRAGKQVAGKGGEFWQLAQDVAKRSLEAIWLEQAEDSPATAEPKKPKPKASTKKKAPAKKKAAAKKK